MNKRIDTWAYVLGVYHDSVTVEFYYQPLEPEVNCGPYCEVEAVWVEDMGNLVDNLMPDEMIALEERLLEYVIEREASLREMREERA